MHTNTDQTDFASTTPKRRQQKQLVEARQLARHEDENIADVNEQLEVLDMETILNRITLKN